MSASFNLKNPIDYWKSTDYLNADELSRIEGNVKFMHKSLLNRYYVVPNQEHKEWTCDGIPDTGDIKRICDNIKEIADHYYKPPKDLYDCLQKIAGGESLNNDDVNVWEECLKWLYDWFFIKERHYNSHYVLSKEKGFNHGGLEEFTHLQIKKDGRILPNPETSTYNKHIDLKTKGFIHYWLEPYTHLQIRRNGLIMPDNSKESPKPPVVSTPNPPVTSTPESNSKINISVPNLQAEFIYVTELPNWPSGANVQYQLHLTNAGNIPTTGWIITVEFPAGVELSQGGNGISESNSGITITDSGWNGAIQPNETIDTHVNFTIKGPIREDLNL